MTEEQFYWLRSLPFELRFSPNNQPKDDSLVAHANPVDVKLVILPPVEVQESLWGRVRQADLEREELANRATLGHV